MRFAVIFTLILLLPALTIAGNYKNFEVAVYARAYEVQQMKDPAWLKKPGPSSPPG